MSEEIVAQRVAHTPAPWRLWHDQNGAFEIMATDCLIVSRNGTKSRAHEFIANARLLVAAPDMLDALRAFCGDYEATPTTDDTSLKAAYLNALAVIAKVTGAQS